MNNSERDAILIRLDQKMDTLTDTVKLHGEKLDNAMPRLAAHSATLKWMKIAGGMALGGISSVFAYMLHNTKP